jgi:hypothetical protein
MPMLPNLMPDLDQLLSALFLVALLLYLFQLSLDWAGLQNGGGGSSAAPFSCGTAIAIAVVASAVWFLR